MILAGKTPKTAKVVILGLTFKENCPDTRNSKVADIIKRLGEYGIKPVVVDPWANARDAEREYGVELRGMEDAKGADCVILAVAHQQFKDMTPRELDALFGEMPQEQKVLIDVKGLFRIADIQELGIAYWRL